MSDPSFSLFSTKDDASATIMQLTTEDVMIPRADITAIAVSTPIDHVFKTIAEHPHSFYPIYEENLDDVIGYIDSYAIAKMASKKKKYSTILKHLMKQPLLVVASLPAFNLLLEMRAKKTYLAIVIDEYGGTDGLVTLHDVIEALFEELTNSSFTPDEELMVEETSNTYIIDARAEIPDFEAKFSVELPLEESQDDAIDTIGGAISSLMGYLPVRGEVCTLENNLKFEVVECTPKRLLKLRFTVPTHD